MLQQKHWHSFGHVTDFACSFVNIGDTDSTKALMRVRVVDFLTFLEVESRLRLCPIRHRRPPPSQYVGTAAERIHREVQRPWSFLPWSC